MEICDQPVLNTGRRLPCTGNNIEHLLRLVLIALLAISYVSFTQSYEVGLLLSPFHR